MTFTAITHPSTSHRAPAAPVPPLSPAAEPLVTKRIVVGTDGSDGGRRAVNEAARRAAGQDATLTIVSSYRPVTDRQLRQQRVGAPADIAWAINRTQDVDDILRTAKAEAVAAGAATITTLATTEAPAVALVRAAQSLDAQLIVVGPPSRRSSRWRPTVADGVVRRAACPVVVCHPAGPPTAATPAPGLQTAPSFVWA